MSHLRTNLPRINYMLDRVQQRGFYGQTLQVMTELLESNHYNESVEPATYSPSAFITKAIPSDEPSSIMSKLTRHFRDLGLWGREPGQERESRSKSTVGGMDVLFDSGANCCVTHCKEDFEELTLSQVALCSLFWEAQ